MANKCSFKFYLHKAYRDISGRKFNVPPSPYTGTADSLTQQTSTSQVNTSHQSQLVPVLASALTHVHAGAGRSPGIVDLPVVRDPLGYPYIPGSEVKGAIKSMLARKYNCVDKEGRINCDNKNNNCRKLCCGLGGEPGDTDAPSMIAITDLYPLLVPLPSLDMGVVFATSPLLISKFLTLSAQTENSLVSLFNKITQEKLKRSLEANKILLLTCTEKQNVKLHIFTSSIEVEAISVDDELRKVESTLRELNPAYGLLGLCDRLVVIPDNIFTLYAEKSLVRLTRVRLRRDTKTVVRGGLWTEEYIPHMTLFSGALINTGFRGKYCDKSDFNYDGIINMIFSNGDSVDIVIGGKESIGKGLLKLKKLA